MILASNHSSENIQIGIIAIGLLLLQIPATAILLARLFKGIIRRPPLNPLSPNPNLLGTVSIIVPTLNEAARIKPCLTGLTQQSYEVREIIIIDSNSQDGTQEIVKNFAETDPRFRLITDSPLPQNWVGRPWALHNGFLHSSQFSQWILGIDADTQPHPNLVASFITAAEAEGFDMVSLSPQFILKYPGEMWLQPALLMTLIYRFGPTGIGGEMPERVMANGQCFLSKRSVLTALAGYSCAKSSFCDDVTLARYAASQGFKVGFLDGAKLVKVRMYEGAAETWQEWGRSLDLKDACSPAQLWGDLLLLLAVQGLPIPILVYWLLFYSGGDGSFSLLLLGLNLFLLAMRIGLNFAIAPSYDRTQGKNSWLFWLSPLADPLAFLRIFLSSLQKPKQWRGRIYNIAGD